MHMIPAISAKYAGSTPARALPLAKDPACVPTALSTVSRSSIPHVVESYRCRIGRIAKSFYCGNLYLSLVLNQARGQARVRPFSCEVASMTTANAPSPVPEKPLSAWIWAFRCLRWSTYLAALITLILLLHKTPPPPVQSSPQAAARAEEKLQQVEESVSQGQKATLRLDESELNSYLASHLDLAKNASAPVATATEASQSTDGPGAPSAADVEQMRSSVRDVKVQMEGDQVRAYVVFDVHGKEMTLDLVGKLGAQDGYLRFEPVSGQIGSLPIPQSTLESAVQRLMDSPENREKLKLPPDVADMHIENGQLVATYQ